MISRAGFRLSLIAASTLAVALPGELFAAGRGGQGGGGSSGPRFASGTRSRSSSGGFANGGNNFGNRAGGFGGGGFGGRGFGSNIFIGALGGLGFGGGYGGAMYGPIINVPDFQRPPGPPLVRIPTEPAAGTIAFQVPEDAFVWVNDHLLPQMGTRREYTTGTIPAGGAELHAVRVKWIDTSGKARSHSENVAVHSGGRASVMIFGKSQPAPAPKPE